MRDYPLDVFQGTRKLDSHYKLEVKEGVPPIVHPSCCVHIALNEKLKEELETLQNLGVIKKETDPGSQA